MEDNWQRYAAAAVSGLLSNSRRVIPDTPEHIASEAAQVADALAEIERERDRYRRAVERQRAEPESTQPEDRATDK